MFQITAYNLRELDFHGNAGILSPVITSLATYYNKIETLDLAQCKIENEEDIESLASYLQKTSTLHELGLRDLQLGSLNPVLFTKFARGLGQNQSIIRLNLSKNKLSQHFKILVDEGLRSYILEGLDLSSNSI